jgi:flagellar motor switch protein FliM
MADVLTQSEMASLLAAPDRPPSADSRRPGMRPGETRREGPLRPEWAAPLQAIHAAFAREFSASCTSLVGTAVAVRLETIQRLLYSEFIEGLEIPACLNLLKIEPLAGHALLQWSPALVEGLVDRLLGGCGSTAAAPPRPLTEIELRLLGRITDLALQDLRHAWIEVCPLEPRVKLMETHPHLLPFGAAETAIVEIRFEIAVGAARGNLCLCLPEEAIESLAGKLMTAAAESGPAPLPEGDRPAESSAASSTGGTAVELVVQLASTRLTEDEIAGLEVGDVIVTDCPPGRPLEVRLDGVPWFTGCAGHFQGRKGVRILERRRPPDEGSKGEPC